MFPLTALLQVVAGGNALGQNHLAREATRILFRRFAANSRMEGQYSSLFEPWVMVRRRNPIIRVLLLNLRTAPSGLSSDRHLVSDSRRICRRPHEKSIIVRCFRHSTAASISLCRYGRTDLSVGSDHELFTDIIMK